MKTIFALICLVLHGCGAGGVFRSELGQEVVHQLPISKQKQRIAFLQKKMELAGRSLQKAQNEFDQLSVDLQQSQLALIGKQVENHRNQINRSGLRSLLQFQVAQKEDPDLFLAEREILQKMLENGPSPEAFEAQIVLDKILRVITEDSL